MQINKRLLPIKLHYFFFMASMGPILPQLSVYGKQLGISSEIMGTITGFLPIMFLISKPLFGLLVDLYRNYRKTIFITLIITMAMCYALLCLIPIRKFKHYKYNTTEDICNNMDICNVTDYKSKFTCDNWKYITCTIPNKPFEVKGEAFKDTETNTDLLCFQNTSSICNGNHSIHCTEDFEINHDCIYKSWHFWYFVILMSLGTIGYNIINSISDAICFDVIEDDFDYGKQRVWGTIGFGTTALIAGIIINLVSEEGITYVPAFMVMIVFIVVDIIVCVKIKLPIIPRPENIFKDLRKLLSNVHTIIFIIFAIMSGIVDSIFVYFLFWYIEDLALATGTKHIKLLEGLIVACETLGGEVIFFSLSGLILKRFGHAYSLSMGFIFYALRLALISLVPSPWWIVPIEFALQGPTYALTYTTIVAYASAISPPGASATMQGIAAGVDDGLGYAVGSVFGGFLYSYVGKSETLQIFAAIALTCSIANFILHRTMVLRRNSVNQQIEYYAPSKATEIVETAG